MNCAQELPPEFLSRMEKQLGDEFPAFLKSFGSRRAFALRVNTSRITPERFEQICPFPIRPVPWVRGGYFYNEDTRPSQCPLYQAGLYYLQDPGAMVPASLLPVEKNDRVLDLCAAPGGKATALLSKLDGTGLLAANDISSSRVRALLRNIELAGGANSLILNEDPERLVGPFAGYFDKILLDAPCSGEGMFRKDPSLASDWSNEKSAALSRLQKKLAENAVLMLRPGGLLLYSTCTFSQEEDEDVIKHLLDTHPGMRLVRPEPWYEGFTEGYAGLSSCVRIYPHKMESEGQFAALLMKEPSDQNINDIFKEESPSSRRKTHGRPGKRENAGRPSSVKGEALQYIKAFFDEIGMRSLGGKEITPDAIEIRSGSVYYVPSVIPDIRGLTFVRNGLYMGILKKNRFEPSHSLALSLLPQDVSARICLRPDDPRLNSFLSGAQIEISPSEAPSGKGWMLLCADDYPLGFGKLTGSTLKNKIPAGWRI